MLASVKRSRGVAWLPPLVYPQNPPVGRVGQDVRAPLDTNKVVSYGVAGPAFVSVL